MYVQWPLSKYDTHPSWLPVTQSAHWISKILRKNRGLWTVYTREPRGSTSVGGQPLRLEQPLNLDLFDENRVILSSDKTRKNNRLAGYETGEGQCVWFRTNLPRLDRWGISNASFLLVQETYLKSNYSVEGLLIISIFCYNRFHYIWQVKFHFCSRARAPEFHFL